MSMGTFDAFTSARLGIYAAQYGLKVTGNNVSNINTPGYTRQRLDQVSFKAGAYDRYRSQMDNHVGSGALVMNINQVRDPYLDVRFRNISAEVGYTDRMLAGLQEIADILDEVNKGEDPASNEKGDGLLHAQIQDLASKLRAYADEPTKANNDLVRGSAETLCNLFNKYADKLEVLYQETKLDFDAEVTEINECLRNIRDLNKEIRNNEVFGDNALELRDERNRQIDKLSQYMHIKVVYSEEDIGNAQTVEKLSIYLDDDNPDETIHTDEILLIDGIFGAQLTSPEKMPLANPKYNPDCKNPDEPAAYRYIKEITKEAEYDDDGKLIAEAEYEYTNKVEEALTRDNDYFGLQVSKLLDDKNREWTNVSKVKGADVTKETPEQAVYEYSIPAKFLKEVQETGAIGLPSGSTLKSENVTIPDDVDLDDPDALAGFIAEYLSKPETGYRYADDYTITGSTDGSGKIIFTAVKEGEVKSTNEDDGAPKFPPELTFRDKNDAVIESLRTCKSNGVVREKPDDYDDYPKKTTDAAGRDTIISLEEKNGRYTEIITTIDHTFETGLDDNDIYGSLQAIRELLTGNGEFATTDTIAKIDENAAKERGIPYYQKALDLLALQFATQYNQINQGFAVDKDGYYLAKVEKMDADGKPVYETLPEHKVTYFESVDGTYLGRDEDEIDKTKYPEGSYKEVTDVKLNLYMTDNAKEAFNDYFKDEGYEDGLKGYLNEKGEPMGGLLFSNRNDRDSEGTPGDSKDPPINASNIAVAHKWSTGEVELVPKYEILFGGDLTHSTQNKNADHMVNMIEKSLVYNPKNIIADADGTVLFKGNFNDMFSRLNTTLGDDIRATNIALNNSYTQQTEIDTMRDGVSGVDLNDEAMNMMQFQKALNAAMRLMTVIDEALDRLINNTGIAGR